MGGRNLRAFVPYREFQMVQLDLERIGLRYVVDGSDRTPDIEKARRLRSCVIASSIEIILMPLEAMPRGPGGKFEQFFSLVPVDWAPTSPPQ